MKEEKIIIIGGLGGGPVAAARARRVNEKACITIIERGGYVSFANCGLPYYISGEIATKNQLILVSPQYFLNRFNIDVRLQTQATDINPLEKIITIVHQDEEEKIPYDKLILAQGGRPILPNIEGIQSKHVFTLRDMEDSDAIYEYLQTHNPKNAIVVGGGFLGIEMTEALSKRGLNVSIVEASERVMGVYDKEFSGMLLDHLQENNVKVYINSSVVHINEKDQTVTLQDGTICKAEIILFTVGVKPELVLAKRAGLTLGETGGVIVNEYLQSSNPDIYVIGDMAEITHRVSGRKVRVPLAGPANRQGRIAGGNASGEKRVYNGAMGSTIVRIFNRALGGTGLNEKALREAGFKFKSVTVHPNHHSGFFPNAKPLTLKLFYDSQNGKVLGAQAFGEEGVDKRIDVLAACIMGELTIYKLAELDLAYAPPFSAVNDPINIAAFVAVNDITAFSPTITAEQFYEEYKRNPDILVLDVRNPDEYAHWHIEGALNIPVNELRKRLNEVPKDKPIYVHCRVGYRAHLATRILLQNGYSNVKNITGGYLSMEVLDPRKKEHKS